MKLDISELPAKCLEEFSSRGFSHDEIRVLFKTVEDAVGYLESMRLASAHENKKAERPADDDEELDIKLSPFREAMLEANRLLQAGIENGSSKGPDSPASEVTLKDLDEVSASLQNLIDEEEEEEN